MTNLFVSSADANSYYQPTTTHALFRGSKGKTGIRFDGSNDVLKSTSVLSSILAADAKTLYFPVKPENISASPRIFEDLQSSLRVYITGGYYYVRHNDGGVDTLQGSAPAAGS